MYLTFLALVPAPKPLSGCAVFVLVEEDLCVFHRLVSRVHQRAELACARVRRRERADAR
jgi:hypothetical protein